MAVGAISVVYLLSTGLSMDKIAYLKIVQSIVLLFGELPTGLFADSYGSRKSLVAGALCSIVGLLIYVFFSGFGAFCIAETLTALSLCFWSGAYEAFSIDLANLEGSKGRMDRFFHQNQSTNNLSVLILGWVGGLLASKNLHFAFFLATILIGLSFLLIYSSPEHKVISHDSASVTGGSPKTWFKRIGQQLSETNHIGLKNPLLLPFFMANILIQFSIQPLLHYWQPAFQEVIGKTSPAVLGNIFAAYCGLSALVSIGFSQLTRHTWARSPITTIFLFLIFSIFYYLFAESRSFVPALIFFTFLQGFLTLARTSMGIRVNEVIPSQYRAAILSSISLVSRIGMMIALFTIGRFLRNDASVFPVLHWFSHGTFVTLFILSLGILLRLYMQKPKPGGTK